jgi:hypothetical protein
MTDYRLPSTAQMGRARLAVSELERPVAFYSGVIGLAVLELVDFGRPPLGVALFFPAGVASGVRDPGPGSKSRGRRLPRACG